MTVYLTKQEKKDRSVSLGQDGFNLSHNFNFIFPLNVHQSCEMTSDACNFPSFHLGNSAEFRWKTPQLPFLICLRPKWAFHVLFKENGIAPKHPLLHSSRLRRAGGTRNTDLALTLWTSLHLYSWAPGKWDRRFSLGWRILGPLFCRLWARGLPLKCPQGPHADQWHMLVISLGPHVLAHETKRNTPHIHNEMWAPHFSGSSWPT